MSNNLIDLVEQKHLRPKKLEFRIGDTVDVRCRIVEGGKERIQTFNGIVIARKGRGVNEMFTVRRTVKDEGVERMFPVHSPNIVDVKVRRHGKARRAKLYFLRDRVGKARKLRELRRQKKQEDAPAEPQAMAAVSA